MFEKLSNMLTYVNWFETLECIGKEEIERVDVKIGASCGRQRGMCLFGCFP
ncbi:MAG: hypothetical protein KKF00_04835 [Proteobacteria bacterium]|nr:hypothetical protein [Pseudomonadota bacterium]